MKINVDLNSTQEKMFNDLVALIKKIGDAPAEENVENYLEVISFLVDFKNIIREGNKNAFIALTLPKTHELVFFDQDDGILKKSKIEDIDFRYGPDEVLDDDYINAINVQLKKNIFVSPTHLINNQSDVEIIKYRLEQEERERSKGQG